MYKFFLCIVCITIACYSYAQDTLYLFSKTKNNDGPWGYKNKEGNVVIPAQFNGIEPVKRMIHIGTVGIPVNDSIKLSYVLRNGRVIGIDSGYINEDNYFDCEREGFIKFRLKDKQKTVGFFNKNGRVQIPAIYNYASSFVNGMSTVLIGATRICIDHQGVDSMYCEHYTWTGGKRMLINTNNEILIDSFNVWSDELDFNSLKLNAIDIDTNLYKSYTTKNGITYSFIHKENFFIHWFNNVFIKALATKNIKTHLFTKVLLEKQRKNTFVRSWLYTNKQHNDIYTYVNNILLTKSKTQCSTDITAEELNVFMFHGTLFDKYYNTCGEHNTIDYPGFEVLVNCTNDKQHSMSFIKTTTGYKLYYLVVR
jgi:hypothetical protein